MKKGLEYIGIFLIVLSPFFVIIGCPAILVGIGLGKVKPVYEYHHPHYEQGTYETLRRIEEILEKKCLEESKTF